MLRSVSEPMMGRRCWLILALAVILTGCASSFTSRVSVFHQLPADDPVKTFEIQAAPNQGESLEFRTYRDQVAAALTGRGYSEAAPARYRVTFEFGVSPQPRTMLRSQPVIAPSFSLGYGYWGRGSGVSLGFGWPGYWGPGWYPYGSGWATVRQTETVQEHRLRLEMTRVGGGAADARVYEGTVLADAYAADMPTVFPLLLRSLLEDFPGRSGESRVVELSIPRR
jgi:hypothetical protein